MKNDIKFRLSLAVLWIISFIIIIFIMCFKSNAQGLPVYVDNDSFVGIYGLDADGFVNAFNNSRYAQSNGLSFSLDVPGTFLINGTEDGYNYTCIYVPTTSYSGDFSTANGVTYYTWDSEFNTLSLSSTYTYYLLWERGELWQAQLYYYSYNQANLTVTLYGSTGIEIGYLTSNYNWSIDPGNIIATNESIPINLYGHATPPINNPDNFVNGLNGHRIPKPTFPTITNYSWTTYNNPVIDTSSVESLLGSIWDSLVYNFSYLFSNLGGLFNTLTNNLEDFVNYLADSLFFVSNNIVSSIQDFATDFYNNMVSLFEPMFDTFAYITEPLDLDRVETSLSSSSSYSLVTSAINLKNTYQDYFDSITVPSTLSFSIPYTILTKSGFIYFDFGWYSDIRDSVLPWIVGFLYMGFGLALFRSFPSIIHGVSGILQKGG